MGGQQGNDGRSGRGAGALVGAARQWKPSGDFFRRARVQAGDAWSRGGET